MLTLQYKAYSSLSYDYKSPDRHLTVYRNGKSHKTGLCTSLILVNALTVPLLR